MLKLRNDDKLLDQSRLAEMKTTIHLLHVDAKGVFKGLALLDDILELQSGGVTFLAIGVCLFRVDDSTFPLFHYSSTFRALESSIGTALP